MPEQKKPWILIAAAVAIVLTIATTIALVDLPGEQLLSRRGSSGAVAVPKLPQASWEMSVRPSGVDGKLTAAQKKAFRRQRPGLRTLVKRVYDALFIHPNHLPAALRESFSEPAALALRRAGAGVAKPGRVATTLRRASIGIQATGGARMAVASITVRAVADGVAKPVVHRSSLWLERARSDWKVVAFDVRQGPRPESASPAGKRGRGQDKKAGKNG